MNYILRLVQLQTYKKVESAWSKIRKNLFCMAIPFTGCCVHETKIAAQISYYK